MFFIVEYLWNYMRNNQKPRTSVLRKKTGKFRFVLIQRTLDVDGGIFFKRVAGSVLYGTV